MAQLEITALVTAADAAEYARIIDLMNIGITSRPDYVSHATDEPNLTVEVQLLQTLQV